MWPPRACALEKPLLQKLHSYDLTWLFDPPAAADAADDEDDLHRTCYPRLTLHGLSYLGKEG